MRTHPDTGEKIRFVNESFTTSICGFDREDSRALLRFLTGRAAQPDFQCRFHWENDSIATWDNRSKRHYAVQDYWPESRIMDLVTIIGDRPV